MYQSFDHQICSIIDLLKTIVSETGTMSSKTDNVNQSVSNMNKSLNTTNNTLSNINDGINSLSEKIDTINNSIDNVYRWLLDFIDVSIDVTKDTIKSDTYIISVKSNIKADKFELYLNNKIINESPITGVKNFEIEYKTSETDLTFTVKMTKDTYEFTDEIVFNNTNN